MAEKIGGGFAETKARMGDYEAVRQVANYVTNPDASEACAIALGFNHGGDSMRAYTEKVMFGSIRIKNCHILPTVGDRAQWQSHG